MSTETATLNPAIDRPEAIDAALEAILAPLREKYGELITLDKDGDVAVFRRITQPEYKRFRAQLFDDKKKPDALEAITRLCRLHPDVATWEQMLVRRPALADSYGEQLLEVAGAGKAERRA